MFDAILRRSPSLISLAIGGALTIVTVPAEAVGPTSVADLADPLLPAVVTISAVQVATASPDVAAPDGPASGTPSPSAAPTAPQQPPNSLFPDLFQDFFAQLGAAAQPSGQSLGSGFVIDPSGIIVTNNHVIDGASQITVNFTDGSSAPAKVVGIDDKTDIAVLQVQTGHPVAAVSFGDSTAVRVGDWVMAVGNPFGFGGSVTPGIVSARNRDINSGPYDAYIQTDASINKGNSGGPLFDMDGKVIGIDTAIVSPSGGSIGIGFAIPSEIAIGVVDQLRQFGETHRGYLGARIQAEPPDATQGAGGAAGAGALVVSLDKPGPAADAGLMAGDVILSFGGVTVDAEHDLPRIVGAQTAGTEVPVVVLRNGMQQTLTVTLGQQPDGQVAAATSPSGAATPAAPNAPATSTPTTPSTSSIASNPALAGGVKGLFGLTLSPVSAAVRATLGISASVTSGVAVVAVDAGSAASPRLQPGDVIVQIGLQTVATPDDLAMKVDALKQQGQMTTLLVVQNKDGYIRFVNLTIQ